MSINQTELLLSEGLDLCVRARELDDNFEKTLEYQIREGMTRSLTMPLWVQDQYTKDLADWEKRARQHMESIRSITLAIED